MALLSYPIFLKSGETFDLRNLYSSTGAFDFDADFTAPTWLSIENSFDLTVGSNAVSETTPVLVKLDDGEDFYCVVDPATPPSLRVDLDELNMLTNSSYDLFLIVQNADTITFESGQTQPTGSSLSDGVFTIGTANGTAYFTATNDDGDIDFSIKINTVQARRNLDEFSDTKRTRVEISGIDVSDDFLELSGISESLDAISLTDFRINDATLALSSDNTNDYQYNAGVANNFWETNSLNAGGYQESVNIFDEYLVNDVWVSHVVFSGVILRATENLEQTQVSLICVDISSRLRNRRIEDFGTREKWAVLTTESTESDAQAVYIPEETLLPIQPETARAWQGSDAITIRRSGVPSEGPTPIDTTAQVTPSALITHRLLSDPPLLNFKTQPRSETLQRLASQLAIGAGTAYQVNIDVDAIDLDAPYILNLGNVSFDIEKTRTTRPIVDWAYDPTNHRILMLLSSDRAGQTSFEPKLGDMLVSLDLETDRYTLLRTFDAGVVVRRIARRDANNYYILSIDEIYQYNTDTDTLTERVGASDIDQGNMISTKPYPFTITGDSTETFLSLKGEFKCIGDTLYFRSWLVGLTPEGLRRAGVWELDTTGAPTLLMHSGLLTSRIRDATFDINADGEIVMVITRNNPDNTDGDLLRIRRRLTDGTFETLFDGLAGSAPAYVHECLRHGDYLYLILSTATGTPYTNLYRYDLTTGTGTTITRIRITRWLNQEDGGVHLFEHDGAVHFMYNLPFYTRGDTITEDALGSVNRIESDGSVTRLGNLWHDAETPWAYSMLDPLSIGEDIHFVMGYGDLGSRSDLFEDDSDASNPENFLHLLYTKDLEYVIANADFSGSPYGALSELARLVNATLSFEQNIVHIRDRNVLRAETDGNTGI